MLDSSLGFAGGVMIAASYWSLLSPALDMAAESKSYGTEGEYAFVPVAIGFVLGCLFVFGTDVLISSLGFNSPEMLLGKLTLVDVLFLNGTVTKCNFSEHSV